MNEIYSKTGDQAVTWSASDQVITISRKNVYLARGPERSARELRLAYIILVIKKGRYLLPHLFCSQAREIVPKSVNIFIFKKCL